MEDEGKEEKINQNWYCQILEIGFEFFELDQHIAESDCQSMTQKHQWLNFGKMMHGKGGSPNTKPHAHWTELVLVITSGAVIASS